MSNRLNYFFVKNQHLLLSHLLMFISHKYELNLTFFLSLENLHLSILPKIIIILKKKIIKIS